VETAKLKLADKTSRLLANLVTAFVVVVLVLFFTVFASISLAIVLGDLTGRFHWGFLIIAGLYLLIALLVWVTKEKLLRIPILNSLLKQLIKDNEHGTD
jgi:hypothetical protein